MKPLNDCQLCKMRNTAQARQAMGCGFEQPAPPSLPVVAWQPAGFPGPDLRWCPGYTTKLNEVAEASWARMYLHKGQLELWCEGEPANDTLLRTVEALELAYAALDAHEAAERERTAHR